MVSVRSSTAVIRALIVYLTAGISDVALFVCLSTWSGDAKDSKAVRSTPDMRSPPSPLDILVPKFSSHHTYPIDPYTILLLLIPKHLLHLSANTTTLRKLLPHTPLCVKRPANLLCSTSNRAIGRELLSDTALGVEGGPGGVCCLFAGVRGANQTAAGGVRGGVFVDAGR